MRNPVPEVGMGATQFVGSDCYPYTVISIDRIDNQGLPYIVTLRADHATRTDRNGLSEHQEYDYTPDEDGRIITVSRRRNGQWREVYSRGARTGFVAFGWRRRYRDPSF